VHWGEHTLLLLKASSSVDEPFYFWFIPFLCTQSWRESQCTDLDPISTVRSLDHDPDSRLHGIHEAQSLPGHSHVPESLPDHVPEPYRAGLFAWEQPDGAIINIETEFEDAL